MFVDGINYTEFMQAEFNKRMRPGGVLPESIYGLVDVTVPGGLNVVVAAGEALIRGFLYQNTAPKTIAVVANSSGSARIDTVVVRLDVAANTCIAQIHAGTPGAGVPALTQVDGGVWEFPLYDITVANGAGSPTLTTNRIEYSRWPASTIVIDAAITTDAELNAAISAEVTARNAAINSAVSSEASTRSTTDTALQNNINGEATTRATADNNEASTRATADNNLQSNINGANTARSNADGSLNARVDREGISAAGLISGGGGGTAGRGYSSVSHPSTGFYTVNLTRNYAGLQVMCTVAYMGDPGAVVAIKAAPITNSQFNVWITQMSGTSSVMIDHDFMFFVTEGV